MYSIDASEHKHNMSVILNGTKSATATNSSQANNNKNLDCAKECPCGVPVIPVPDQWLEVMVTGGFKVWHIIFIIIAFVVTLVVVYCCFHRCRIPRTKQEIEADLMRSTIAQKFRDYLQELPNEPTTFMEALKKVQDIEEKLEQDDAMLSRDLGARKRMGWLKLKGKDKAQANTADNNKPEDGEQQPDGSMAKRDSVELLANNIDEQSAAATGKPKLATKTRSTESASHLIQMAPPTAELNAKEEKKKEPEGKAALGASQAEQPADKKAAATRKRDQTSNKMLLIKTKTKNKHGEQLAKEDDEAAAADGRSVPSNKKAKLKSGQKLADEKSKQPQPGKVDRDEPVEEQANKSPLPARKPIHPEPDGPDSAAGEAAAAPAASSRTRRKRDKPNLSRTKAQVAKLHPEESTERPTSIAPPQQLELPSPAIRSHQQHHSQQHHVHIDDRQQQHQQHQPNPTTKTTKKREKRKHQADHQPGD